MVPKAGPLVIKVIKLGGKTAAAGVGVLVAFNVFGPIRQWRLRKIPGNFCKPSIGDALDMYQQGLTEYVDSACAKYSNSPIFKVWTGTGGTVVVRDTLIGVDLLKEFELKKESSPVPWAPSGDRKMFGDTMLFVNGSKWVKGRKAIQATVMHAAALNSHVPSMLMYIDRLVQELERLSASNTPINVQACAMSMTLDAITQAIFGLDIRAEGATYAHTTGNLSNAAEALSTSAKLFSASLLSMEDIENGWWDKYPLGSAEFAKNFVSTASALSTKVVVQAPLVAYLCMGCPVLTPLWRVLARVLPTKNVRLYRKLFRGMQRGTLKLVEAWKAQHPAGQLEGARGMMPYIVSSTESGAQFDEYLLLGTVISALFGGYETTGSTLAQSLYCLAKNPEVQKKAQEEVDRVLGGKVPDVKDLKAMPYLDGVVDEALRLASPAALTTRWNKEDYEHPSGAFRIPGGFTVWFPLYTYLRDPSIWPRAEEFLPERHIQPGNEDLAPTDPRMLVTFGVGVRRCPGYKYALLQVRLSLIRLLQRFEFVLTPECPEPVMSNNFVYLADKVMLRVLKRGAVGLGMEYPVLG